MLNCQLLLYGNLKGDGRAVFSHPLYREKQCKLSLRCVTALEECCSVCSPGSFTWLERPRSLYQLIASKQGCVLQGLQETALHYGRRLIEEFRYYRREQVIMRLSMDFKPRVCKLLFYNGLVK